MWIQQREEGREGKQDDPENVTHDNQNVTDNKRTSVIRVLVMVTFFFAHLKFIALYKNYLSLFCLMEQFFFLRCECDYYFGCMHSVCVRTKWPKLDFLFMKLSPTHECPLMMNINYTPIFIMLITFGFCFVLFLVFRGGFLCPVTKARIDKSILLLSLLLWVCMINNNFSWTIMCEF